jgi:hypothetical protein
MAMNEQALQVPAPDASRLEWARYFLASAEVDVQYKAQALVWNHEQIAYHRAKLQEYQADCKELEVRIKAARAEVKRLKELVGALEETEK